MREKYRDHQSEVNQARNEATVMLNRYSLDKLCKFKDQVTDSEKLRYKLKKNTISKSSLIVKLDQAINKKKREIRLMG